MSASRRTPRYVEAIGAHPMGPQRMGPHPVADLPAEERPSYTGVLPLRPHLAVVPPEAPAPAVPLPGPRRRARVVPVERRPWRVLIVSSAPGAAPRSFQVRRWQARMAIAVVSVSVMLAVGFVAAVVVAVRTPDLFGERAEAEALRAELAATRDSLGVMRTSLTAVSAAENGDGAPEGPVPSASGATVPAVTPVPVTPHAAPAAPAASRAPVERAKPLRARTGRTGGSADEGRLLASMPRSLSELPVIGALVSGFSRARRHPLLHITRPHLGVDLAAPRGTRVSAPAAGRVRFVGRRIGYGLVVELDHGDGVTTRYAHLRSAAVEAGEHVTKGEAIAAVGTSGITTGPHLHYEVLVHGRQVDPMQYHFAGAAGIPVPSAATATAPAPSPAPAATPPVAGTAAPAAVGTHESMIPLPR